MTGTLYGLGIGPGDPELITLKALRLLQAADVVAYPAPEQGDSLARRIVAPHLSGGQAELAIRMPLSVARFPAQAVYEQAAGDLAAHLKAGRNVAVLCEGDPFLYGSFMYLFGRLSEDFPVEIVPGVSSLTACAAALQYPLVSRNDVLTVIPAPLDDETIAHKLLHTDAAAILKLGRHGRHWPRDDREGRIRLSARSRRDLSPVVPDDPRRGGPVAPAAGHRRTGPAPDPCLRHARYI